MLDFNAVKSLIENKKIFDIDELEGDINQYGVTDTKFDSHDSSSYENYYECTTHKTLLHIAIECQNTSAVMLLLDRNANTKLPIKMITERTQTDITDFPNRVIKWSPEVRETLTIDLARKLGDPVIISALSEKLGLSEEDSTDKDDEDTQGVTAQLKSLVTDDNPSSSLQLQELVLEEKPQLQKTKSPDAEALVSAIPQITPLGIGNKSFLSLYESFLGEEETTSSEMKTQSYVNNRFFRLGRSMKEGAPSKAIFDKLVALHSKGLDASNSVYLTNANKIPLDGYSARSVIIALTQFLRQYHCIPTAVYTIGSTHIRCTSKPTRDQKGNVELQVIDRNGEKVFCPSVYGHGNGNTSRSIAWALIKQGGDSDDDFYKRMSSKIKNIETLKHSILDQVNFLSMVIEIARYSYDANFGVRIPVGVAQMRTSQLLVAKLIKTQEAFGLSHYSTTKMLKCCGEKITEAELHKAPYGAVTGKDIRNNVDEVEEKVKRINKKYRSKHSSQNAATTFMFEGNNLLRKRLGETFGSGDESEGANYSDNNAPLVKSTDFRRVPLL